MSSVVLYPLATEKSIRMMEKENKLIFVVKNAATKTDVKRDVESLFNVKVTKVTTTITPQGTKKAYVKFSKEYPALDVATQLGMM